MQHIAVWRFRDGFLYEGVKISVTDLGSEAHEEHAHSNGEETEQGFCDVKAQMLAAFGHMKDQKSEVGHIHVPVHEESAFEAFQEAILHFFEGFKVIFKIFFLTSRHF